MDTVGSHKSIQNPFKYQVEDLAKIVTSLKPLNIFAKKLHPICLTGFWKRFWLLWETFIPIPYLVFLDMICHPEDTGITVFWLYHAVQRRIQNFVKHLR